MTKTINKFIDNLDVSSGVYRFLIIIAALLIVLVIFLNSYSAYGPSDEITDSVPSETIKEHINFTLIKE